MARDHGIAVLQDLAIGVLDHGVGIIVGRAVIRDLYEADRFKPRGVRYWSTSRPWMVEVVEKITADEIGTHIEAALAEVELAPWRRMLPAAVVIKHRGKPRSEITHAVESAAREETLHLHAGIAVLDTVITIAPLLGLLGTASGLVLIFQGLGDNSDHLAIARGIAEALTTTIFGLAIAVPCVIAHGYFVRRIEMLIEDDGPGIVEKDRDAAMQSGGRLDTSKPGSGLGLAIATDLLKAYGASLELGRSATLDGLSVRILLPFRAVAADRIA